MLVLLIVPLGSSSTYFAFFFDFIKGANGFMFCLSSITFFVLSSKRISIGKNTKSMWRYTVFCFLNSNTRHLFLSGFENIKPCAWDIGDEQILADITSVFDLVLFITFILLSADV